ncbi:hypothetical protein ACFL1B_00780 [Nanoarchaeota archaeon]
MRKLLLLLVLLLLIPNATAIALGVNKAGMNFRNVLKGGYAEDVVTATTDTPNLLELNYEIVGDIADWVTLMPSNESQWVFSSQSALRITVIVQPPPDTANGIYTGEVRLLTGAFARTEGQYGSAVHASFAVKLSVEITGEEILACTAGGFELLDTETGYPLQVHASVKNNGNVQVLPVFDIDVWDQYKTKLVMSTQVAVDQRILPTRQQSYVQTFEHELPLGQYWANIKEPTCGDNHVVTFSVLELGGISDQGELIRIDNQAWAETEDIVRIAAIFKNKGRRVVSAKFKGTIERDGKVIEVIDTDTLNVLPQRTTELETFFNPTEPGRYTVKGHVIYNGKITFEKSSMVNVRGDVGPRVTGNVILNILTNPYQMATIFILLAVVVLLFLIQKEKKKRKRPY